jgi:hypothetical protein
MHTLCKEILSPSPSLTSRVQPTTLLQIKAAAARPAPIKGAQLQRQPQHADEEAVILVIVHPHPSTPSAEDSSQNIPRR